MSRTAKASAMHGESGHERVANDAYYTLDADWIVPALLDVVKVEGPTLEPCSGAGHMVAALRAASVDVVGHELYHHDAPVAADIVYGQDVFDLTPADLAGFRWVVSNLPYDLQDDIVSHLLNVASVTRTNLAFLVRAEWPIAQRRHQLVHTHPAFDAVIQLTKRPRWVPTTVATTSPRHNFAWCVWRWDREDTPPSIHFRPRKQHTPTRSGDAA